jgi:peroxiredoxin
MVPWVREWYEKYEGENFAVIGIHFPKAGESFDKVAQEMEELDATYPIAVDKNGTSQRAYTLQHYWPIRYLIDKEGNIRYMYIGEGAYEETEYYIEALMAEADLDQSR